MRNDVHRLRRHQGEGEHPVVIVPIHEKSLRPCMSISRGDVLERGHVNWEI